MLAKAQRRSTTCWALALASLAGALGPRDALAQKLLIDGTASVHSGLEGADPGIGAVEWQRQRTRLLLGAEWSSSESKRQSLGLYGLFELERSGSIGAEFRYRSWMNEVIGAYVGPVAVLRPQSLYGGAAGIDVNIPLGSRLGVFAEASFAAFPIGSDRPTPSAIVMWASLGLGAKLQF
jgi:hypothetical protein